MLKGIRIKNFKSILDDSIPLGKINVFIGENGSGKSNILEALMFASLAETYKTVDADVLYTNGVRVSRPSLLLSSFKGMKRKSNVVEIKLQFIEENIDCRIKPEKFDDISSKWEKEAPITDLRRVIDLNHYLIKGLKSKKEPSKKYQEEFLLSAIDIFEDLEEVIDTLEESSKKKSKYYNELSNFIIYTLNTEVLRGIPEFQKSRKGIYGETLDIIISELSRDEQKELREFLYIIPWIEDFFIDIKDELKQEGYKLNYSKSLLYFKDKYMLRKNNVFSSENSNEGALHVLFYLANIISSKTPRLFAIDNIETALNPHLCRHIMFEICNLAKKKEKQILITTHNPAILDGLDLFDDDVRLFEVFRTDRGDTKTRRIQVKPSFKDKDYKLSELWTRGFLGAISEKF